MQASRSFSEPVCTRRPRTFAHASNARPGGFCSPELVRDAETNGRAEVWAVLTAATITAQVGVRSKRVVQRDRVRTRSGIAWALSRSPQFWPGAEQRDDRAVAGARQLRVGTGRALAGVGGN